jgi:phosphatidate cytidylyltransferase
VSEVDPAAPIPPTPDAKFRTPSNLRLRMIASVAMIGIASIALYVGGLLFWLLAAVGAMLMLAEWADLHRATPREKQLSLFALFVAISAMAPVAWGPGFFTLGLIAAAFFFVVIVTRRPQLSAGAFYVGLPVFALLLIRQQQGWVDGLLCAFWALALVWATDIGAYFAGRTIGGPKLAPAISPAKTWAGLAGGIVAASALAAALHGWFGLPLRLTLATPMLAVVAQIGDLFESALKRKAGVKDSGNLLPGHGGVLDRLDGLVPVAPLAAALVVYPVLLQP